MLGSFPFSAYPSTEGQHADSPTAAGTTTASGREASPLRYSQRACRSGRPSSALLPFPFPNLKQKTPTKGCRRPAGDVDQSLLCRWPAGQRLARCASKGLIVCDPGPPTWACSAGVAEGHFQPFPPARRCSARAARQQRSCGTSGALARSPAGPAGL